MDNDNINNKISDGTNDEKKTISDGTNEAGNENKKTSGGLGKILDVLEKLIFKDSNSVSGEVEKEKHAVERRRLAISIVILIFFSLFILSFLFSGPQGPKLQPETLPSGQKYIDPFENISIEADAIYVYDVNNKKVIFAKNADKERPLASLTKIMTVLVASDLLPGQTIVNLDKKSLGSEGDTGLLVDEKWKLSDLIDYSLIVSSNDGAMAIASVAGSVGQNTDNYEAGREQFIRLMNLKAQKIGAKTMTFSNETGLDIDKEKSGAYGTAKDIALLFEYALKNHPEIIEATALNNFKINSLNNITHNATNTNEVIDRIPGIIGSKTGFTDLSGGNVVVAFDPGLGRPIIISILGSSIDGRFSDLMKVASSTLMSIQRGK